ncbi:MAG: signal peptidase I [Candidatus Sungbacteria bacterium]|nr:signal peptidase I [Candidatus Sungbacteria bacterium]
MPGREDELKLEERVRETVNEYGMRQDLWEIVRVLLLSIAIVLPIRYFIAQPFIVRGASMEPNFHDSQYLIIDEASLLFREPHRGEVVVFRYPRDRSQFFIKRIIALPGEEISIREGRVVISNAEHPTGFALEESYLDPPGRLSYPDMLPRKLDRDEYFVMGDNRDASSDSRIWGMLDRKLITGRTFLRVWPASQFGIVTSVATD